MGCLSFVRQPIVSPRIFGEMGTDDRLDTFAKRLAWVLANRRQKDGSPWDQKTLSVTAGLSTSHVGQYVRGDQTNPTLEILRKLGKAADVSAAWLGFGVGSPDAIDGDPSYSDSSVPIARNVPGWAQVLRHDQAMAAASPAGKLITPDAWQRSDLAARYLIHGPAAPGDALRLARLATELADEGRFDRAYDANLKELQAGESAELAEAKAFEEAVKAKARGERPKRAAKTVAAAERELGKRATEGIDETSGKRAGK